MAILVKPVQRANPSDEKAPKKWYVTQVTAAQVDETQVSVPADMLSAVIEHQDFQSALLII